jgi:hypothetical protein
MFAALWSGRLRLSSRAAWSILMAPFLVGLVACSGSAPPPASTAKPAATKPASTPAAKASPSPGSSAQASASPSPGASQTVQILDATLADATPWVSLRLSGGEPLIVSGWRLEVGDKSATIPGNAIIQPGETLTLHAGEGQSSDREVFLGAESNALALAAAPNARVRLLDASGAVMAETTIPRY